MRSRPAPELPPGFPTLAPRVPAALGLLAALLVGAPAEAGWRGVVTFAGETRPVEVSIFPRQALPAGTGRCRALPDKGDVDVALRAADCLDVASNLELLKRARAFKPARPTLELATDELGTFEAGSLGSGAYDVLVRNAELAWYVRVEAGAKPVAIELPANERYAFGASRRVAEALRSWPRDEKPWVIGLDVPIVVPPSDDRRAALPVLPEGTYAVIEETGRRRVVVSEGLPPLVRRPEDFLALEGTVTENGRPVAGVEVVLAEHGRAPKRVRTDREGRFTIQASRVGLSSVAAARREACVVINEVPKPRLRAPEEKPPRLSLELEPCRAQVLRVTDEKGRPLPAQVAAYFEGGRTQVYAGAFSDGRLLLPQGKFKSVYVHAPGAAKRLFSSPLPQTMVLPALVRHTVRLRTASGSEPTLERCDEGDVDVRFAESAGAWELATEASMSSLTCSVRGYPALSIPLTPSLTTFEVPSLTAVHLPERLGDHRADSWFDDLRPSRLAVRGLATRFRLHPGPLAVTTCETEPPGICAFVLADVPTTDVLDLEVAAPPVVDWTIEVRDSAGPPLPEGTRLEAVGGNAGERVFTVTKGMKPAPIRSTEGWFQVSWEDVGVLGWCLAGRPCRLQKPKPPEASQLTLAVEGSSPETVVTLDDERTDRLAGDQLVRPVPPGEHVVVVDGSLVTTFTAAPPAPVKVRVAAVAPAAQDVEVVDETGRPVVGARVLWGFRKGVGRPFSASSAISEAQTDASGRAHFDGVRVGPPAPRGVPGVLRVLADGHDPVAVDPRPGTTRVVLPPERTVEIDLPEHAPNAVLDAQVFAPTPPSVVLTSTPSGALGEPLTVSLPSWPVPTRLAWSASMPRADFLFPEVDTATLPDHVVAPLPKEGARLIFPSLGDQTEVTVYIGVRLAPDELSTKGSAVVQAYCSSGIGRQVCLLGPVPKGPATAVLRRSTARGRSGPGLVWSFEVGQDPVQVIRPGPQARAEGR